MKVAFALGDFLPKLTNFLSLVPIPADVFPVEEESCMDVESSFLSLLDRPRVTCLMFENLATLPRSHQFIQILIKILDTKPCISDF
ncbi:hypothetical protein D3C78_1745950 [compost metagenome]